MAADTTSQFERGAPIRIGLLRLTDAAPLVIAAEKNFFAARDLDVRLLVEPSWANIADKLTFGHLDAAVLLPPLALAMALGLRGTRAPLVVPMGLSLNGNSITVSHAIAETIGEARGAMEVGARFAAWAKTQSLRPRLAVVHMHSTHNLLLRYWLAAVGVDPDKDVEICVVPPPETALALKSGEIDGFCAGAPWGSVATANGAGRTIVVSSQIWRDHPEKCLAVGAFAEREPRRLQRLLDAVLNAARFCDDPANAEEIARILSAPRYLNVDPEFVRASLPVAGGAARGDVDCSTFAARGANVPKRAHARWFLGQMARWGFIADEAANASVDAIYRPDLIADFADVSDAPDTVQFCDGATLSQRD